MTTILNILKSNKLDYKQELLWMDIKKNFTNLIEKYNIEFDLDEESNLLNELQNQNLLELINKQITSNLIKYAKYSLLKNDYFHINICYKQMKKLIKIIELDNAEFNQIMELLKLKKNLE